MDYDRPHRRLNSLTGEWLLVSPHRARRPWLGQVEKPSAARLPGYDPTCYLCPGNTRNTGAVNPAYTGTFVFENDFSALLPPAAESAPETSPRPELSGAPARLFQALPDDGICRVICFSPRHDLTLPELPQPWVEDVIRTWADQTAELGARDFINYVQVFENKGEMMGCSNPHPHSQVWSTSLVPTEAAKELQRQEAYLRENGRCLLCELLEAEQAAGERVVAANAYFTAVVPFWAVWPFEILVLSHRHVASLPELTPAEVAGLADLLRRVTARYDNLFEISFPYSMGFHQQPCGGGPYPGWHLHAHFYPPLLRSAAVRKFMVGFEMLAMPQRDLTPETAAARLRGLPELHYKLRGL